MRYDFDALIDRRKTNSLKWNVRENELPMWVADMDFPTAPQVTETVVNRAKSGIFGYAVVGDTWYEAIINWWQRRHGFSIEKEWLCFCTGVVPAVTSIVKRITNVGDCVLVQTPVYDMFFHSIENTGRTVLENQLSYDGKSYSIDFEDMERKLSQPLTTMMILCNPHNPIGKIWSKGELLRIGALCKKYGVTVLSDEIHCDLTNPDSKYIPFASVSADCLNNSVTCVSASKAFNLAGLQSAAVIVSADTLRNKVVRGLNSDEAAEPNCFAAEAAAAAFNEGAEWLDELRGYLAENRREAEEFIKREIPDLKLLEQDATYLLWIDCGRLTDDSEELCDFIRRHTGLYLSSGNRYRGNGNRFTRMNAACPRSMLKEGLLLLKNGIEEFKKTAEIACHN